MESKLFFDLIEISRTSDEKKIVILFSGVEHIVRIERIRGTDLWIIPTGQSKDIFGGDDHFDDRIWGRIEKIGEDLNVRHPVRQLNWSELSECLARNGDLDLLIEEMLRNGNGPNLD
ncbi:hypothetical protein EJP69_24930 [Variovorax gossypii]|uniref:Uncharacterized protein n=1 Tax=Variovorax gossypii TaxID=1679495 RepID=A0A3S0JSW4_9BURK|nr:hypothetical protein [Variovorax gossypii]RTQ31886.1 hypothetical protein EJP69_24930 [Variovorax gossypii]